MFFFKKYTEHAKNKKTKEIIINEISKYCKIPIRCYKNDLIVLDRLKKIFNVDFVNIANKIIERKKVYGNSFEVAYKNYLSISETKSRYNSNEYRIKFICNVLMAVKQARILDICNSICFDSLTKNKLNSLLYGLEDSVIDYFAYKQISENYNWYLDL